MSERSENQTAQAKTDGGKQSDQRRDHHWETDSREDQPGLEGPPLVEWIVAAIGFVLVAGAVGFLVYQALKDQAAPPDLVIMVDSISPVGSGYLVTFRAINQGGTTAEGVVVEGTLKQGENSVESSETDLNYIPSGSEINGGIFFTKDPRLFQLQLRAHGYEQP